MDLYVKSGNKNAAITLGEEAQIQDPSFWAKSQEYGSGYYKLIDLYKKTGRPEDALRVCQEAKEKSPDFLNSSNNYTGYLQMVSVYEELGKLDEAIELLLEARDQDKSFWKATFGDPRSILLADLYAKNGQPAQAIEVYEELKKQNPDEYWKGDYYKICQLFEQAGQADQANQLRDELITKLEDLRLETQDETDFPFNGLEPLANLYIQRGQEDLAIAVLEETREKSNYFPMRTRIYLADLYVKQGEKEKAAVVYQSAIDIYKENNKFDDIDLLIKRAESQGISL